jgi:glycerol-1-phosphate dehydrogenase [NAD(P)+]
MVSSLDWDGLHRQADELPNDARLVVGIGGGKALDASKFFALKKDLPLILVPTAVSTGAIIHGIFAKFKGRTSVPGGPEAWPYCDCEHVLVDHDLTLEAPWYLNTAGLGDVLCGFGGIAEWRYTARNGQAPDNYAVATKPTLAFFQSVVDGFTRSLDNRALTPASIKVIMEAIRDRDDKGVRSPHAPSADHSLFGLVEPNVERPIILHGELTALVSLIVSWATGYQDEHLDRLTRCKVRFRPTVIGIKLNELRWIMERIPEFLAARKVNSILAREPIIGKRFDALWNFLETS